MDTRFINHRRDRQQIRRFLADIRSRGRDLTGSFIREEFDLVERMPHPANDNAKMSSRQVKGGQA